MNAPKLFISFSSKDVHYAEAFYEALTQTVARENIFFAPTNVLTSEVYYKRIMEFLEETTALIVLASANSVGCTLANTPASKHVEREIKEADDKKIPFFPVDIDGVLKRDTYDAGIRYFLGSAQYCDGQAAREFGNFSPLVASLLDKILGNKESQENSWTSRLSAFLSQQNYCEANAMVAHVCTDSYPPRARILAVAARLSNNDRLNRLSLEKVARQVNELQAALASHDCDSEDRTLAYYILGVLCREFYQPNVIKCPLGSYSEIREQAKVGARMSLASKKLVRGVSRDFRAFESSWFFSG